MTRFLLLAAVLAGASLAAPREAQAQGTRRITCESRDRNFEFCEMPTRGYARLLHNVSDTRCVLNRTWGFDQRGVWVDRGCRGVFEVGGAGGSGWETGDNGRLVTCESRDKEYQFCRVNTRGDVRLARRLSERPCMAGKTWGFQADGIWVTSGCRAEFEVGYSDVDWSGNERQVKCESDDRKYTRCRVWTYGTARLVRQLSDTRCSLNRTWGYDRDGIWVDEGCRAVFAVGVEQGGGGWGQYPGGGGSWDGAGGSWEEVRRRGGEACVVLARQRGFGRVTVKDTQRRKDDDVWVIMRGALGGDDYDVSCYYTTSRRRAEILGQQLADAGGGGSSGVENRAREACTLAATRMGYSGVRTTKTDRLRNEYLVTQEGWTGGRQWRLGCRYSISSKQARVTEQSELRPRPK